MPCKNTKIEIICPCPSTSCQNHGVCCQCVKNHRDKGQLPYCLRDIAKKM